MSASRSAPPEEWSQLSLVHMLDAYRKAKADCFFERSIYQSEEFADFESELSVRLEGILARLKAGEIANLIKENIGQPCLLPKKLTPVHRDGATAPGHTFFSDPKRSFEAAELGNALWPEFRVSGRFNVTAHILSALWINLVGHRYDERLSSNAYGSRLRRYGRAGDNNNNALNGYHYEAIGSFEPYFRPYQAWRDNGFQKIERSLKSNEQLVALTLDFASYYHNIDFNFMVDEDFLERSCVKLTPWQRAFTVDMLQMLTLWSEAAASFSKQLGSDGLGLKPPGLPIGISIVRIVSNVILIEFDQKIKECLLPIYYGRYVDDIFLVLSDPGNIKTADQLWSYVSGRCDVFSYSLGSNLINVELPGTYSGASKLVLQQSKQKIFFLSGESGLDLLQSIAAEVRSLSSERRLLPLPDELDGAKSARVLAAAEQSAEEAVSLRRADGLTIRRLGWALQLRSVEILARNVEASSWRDQRRSFYRFAKDHIVRPDRILSYFDYLPRLLSLAVFMSDWEDAEAIFKRAHQSIDKLEFVSDGGSFYLNGEEEKQSSPALWEALRTQLNDAALDAALRALPWKAGSGKLLPLGRKAMNLLRSMGAVGTATSMESRALSLREADLGKLSYKEHLRVDAIRQRPKVDGEDALLLAYGHGEDLERFLTASLATVEPGVFRVRKAARADSQDYGSAVPFMTATRAYTAEEIALYLPQECAFGDPTIAAERWAKHLRAVRGNWAHTDLDPVEVMEPASTRLFKINEPDTDGSVVDSALQVPEAYDGSLIEAVVGGEVKFDKVLLGVTSLKTTEESWSKAASGHSDLSAERFERIVRIVNMAVTAKPRPTHLLLPELSLPAEWIHTVSALLQDAGINLIVGLDYHVEGNTVSSSAALVLRDTRLGYGAPVQIRQTKQRPAPGEERDLLKQFGLQWFDRGAFAPKPIYSHGGLFFGVLVCSELQDIRYRSHFRGAVDALFVLSWNKDLETFSALVESASLDVHAYIALVNNRSYGDSRVRSPERQSFDRDICRVRGGRNELLVVVEIEPIKLRRFQNRAKNWSDPGDKFKPTPEGFVVSVSRKMRPA